MIQRTEVIQRIIDKKKAQTYLEIGVSAGTSFMPIKIRHKIAVDPKFTITQKYKNKWIIKNSSNLTAEFHESTSDAYFTRTPNKIFDVVFIDGLHTYEQSLKDAVNVLGVLNQTGIIILHDCLPPHRAAASPHQLSQKQAAELSIPGWTPEWCGEVWKTICHLRSRRDDLRIHVLNCDYGLGIVMRGRPDSRLDLKEEQLKKMTYEDLLRDKENLLNLKDESYFAEFLATL